MNLLLFSCESFRYANYVCSCIRMDGKNGTMNRTNTRHTLRILHFSLFFSSFGLGAYARLALPLQMVDDMLFSLSQCNFHLNLRVRITIRMFYTFQIWNCTSTRTACANIPSNHSYLVFQAHGFPERGKWAWCVPKENNFAKSVMSHACVCVSEWKVNIMATNDHNIQVHSALHMPECLRISNPIPTNWRRFLRINSDW